MSPQILIGAVSSSSTGCSKKISRDLAQRARTSFSASLTSLPFLQALSLWIMPSTSIY
jgi:hypothetical protein